MKKLVIIGAGGFGREVYTYAHECEQHAKEWEVRGFIDDNPKALEGFAGIEHSILSGIEEYDIQDDDVFTCAIGQPRLRKRLAEIILNKGGKFIDIIHPRAYVGRNVRIGNGAIICPGAVLTSDILLGEFVCLNVNTVVGHNATIGSWTQTSCLCDITGYVTLGEGVFMGSHASVLPSVKVGNWAIIGAGAIVIRKVRDEVTVAGVPARPLPSKFG